MQCRSGSVSCMSQLKKPRWFLSFRLRLLVLGTILFCLLSIIVAKTWFKAAYKNQLQIAHRLEVLGCRMDWTEIIPEWLPVINDSQVRFRVTGLINVNENSDLGAAIDDIAKLSYCTGLSWSINGCSDESLKRLASLQQVRQLSVVAPMSAHSEKSAIEARVDQIRRQLPGKMVDWVWWEGGMQVVPGYE